MKKNIILWQKVLGDTEVGAVWLLDLLVFFGAYFQEPNVMRAKTAVATQMLWTHSSSGPCHRENFGNIREKILLKFSLRTHVFLYMCFCWSLWKDSFHTLNSTQILIAYCIWGINYVCVCVYAVKEKINSFHTSYKYSVSDYVPVSISNCFLFKEMLKHFCSN